MTVTNVAPTVVDARIQRARRREHTVTVTGVVTDPGWLDPLTRDDRLGRRQLAGSRSAAYSRTSGPTRRSRSARPTRTATTARSRSTVCGRRRRHDHCALAFAVEVDNVDPTAVIDETGTTLVNGIPTFIVSAGEPVTFAADVDRSGQRRPHTHMGLGRRHRHPDVSTTYLVNSAASGPGPEPQHPARDVDRQADPRVRRRVPLRGHASPPPTTMAAAPHDSRRRARPGTAEQLTLGGLLAAPVPPQGPYRVHRRAS